MKTESGNVVRKTFGNGKWFPGDGETLRKDVEDYVAKAEAPAVEGRIVGAIAPHAGYDFSGKVAGHVFKAIRENARGDNAPETVVILGLAHRSVCRGLALMDGDAIESPLGRTALDKESAAILTNQSPRIRMDYGPHMGEHSAENEIPFVQVALPKARLVVGIIGEHDAELAGAIAAALGELAKRKRILAVASSDMLHDPDYDLVSRTDRATLKKVEALDWKGVMKNWGPDAQTFCGIMPVLSVMRFAEAQGCKAGTLLKYRNSGDDDPSGRGRWVVGYGAVVFSSPK